MQQVYDISNVGRKLNCISFEPLGSKDIRASQEAKLRLNILEKFDILRSKGIDIKDIVKVLEVSRATIYRWQALYKQGFDNLKPKSRKPIIIRKPAWSSELAVAVARMRKKYPLWGKYKLHIMLARDGVIASISTIGRIISGLIKRRAILSVNALLGENIPKMRRRFVGHAKRISSKDKSQAIGELVQIDHMTVRVGDRDLKHFNAWDKHSKYNFADVYGKATSYCASKFLEQIIKESPFKIKSIQVDGGSEFMKDFEDTCQKLSIPLFVLPPRSPKMNGGVERINRTWRDEFYNFYQDLPDNILELSTRVKKYQAFYNQIRPHQNIDNLTPACYVENVLSDGFESHML